MASLLDKLAADFAPDFTPNQVLEFNKGQAAPDSRVASMEKWPDRWHLGGKGWIQWYADQSAGIASEHDDRQKARWRSYKARHGAQYVKNPTPRRAASMRNWGIDAPKLLPEDQREAARQALTEYLQKKAQ